jgi:peptidyl-prolyl cis-trans isomerase C
MIRTLRLLGLLGIAAACARPGLSAAPADATNGAAAQPAAAAAPLFPDAVVAKGKGFEVKRSALDAEVIRQKARAAASGAGAALPPDLEARLLSRMIQVQLLMARATPQDKEKGKANLEAYLKRLKTASKLNDEEFSQRITQQLHLTGQTREEWDKQNLEQATIPVVLEHEIRVTVTDADAKSYYDANTAKFEEPERVHVSHILLSTREPDGMAELSADKKAAKRKQADDILKRAREGADWAKLVKDFSEDPGSKETGGEYTFTRGQMVPEFELAAFALKTNQISEVVTTKYGYHIIKLLDRTPARKEAYAGLDTKTVLTKSDGEKAPIREVLSDEARSKQLPEFLAKMEKDADVQILDEKLKLKATDETPQLPAGHPPVNSSKTPAGKPTTK